MRILHAIASTDPATGGPVAAIVQVGSVLAAQGHHLEVVCVDPPDAPWLPSFPFEVHALGPAWGKYGFTPTLVPWLRDRASDYDIIIVHGLWQYPSVATWLALRRSRVPYVVYAHGMLDPWFKRTYPLKHLKKWLYWLLAEYRVLRDARGVLFTCEEEAQLARHSFWPYRCCERIAPYTTAGSPGDLGVQRQVFLADFPALADKRLVLFLSRIHAKKGCDLAIQAFAGIMDCDPRLHLAIAGPDEMGWQRELMSLAQRCGASDRITWTGPLYGDRKWGAFAAAEVFFLPSHQENFGIVVAEALSTGTPVLISTQVNIWREIAADGAGLVAADTLKGATELLQRWLAMSEEARQAMQAAALPCYRDRFAVERAAERLLSVLKDSSHGPV